MAHEALKVLISLKLVMKRILDFYSLPVLVWLLFYPKTITNHPMKNILIFIVSIAVLFLSSLSVSADNSQKTEIIKVEQSAEKNNGTSEMLSSLLHLQKNLREQIRISRKKLKASSSEAEKKSLEDEINQLDRQLSETAGDFERIATGVEPALFAEKKPETFSWKNEMASLLEPAIKELKRFTIRARHKSDLKERIGELQTLADAAGAAVDHLELVMQEVADSRIRKEVKDLLPEWKNIEDRLHNKLELAQSELANLQSQEVSLVESSSKSVKDFFRARGRYLIIALATFFGTLFGCRLLYRLIVKLYFRTGGKGSKSFQLRLLYIFVQVLSVVLAIVGLFFVLYLAEDWFLLSMAIVFFLGLAWTIRQALPRLWQQGRLMLNVGSVRERERLILHGVPWKVESINVFCRLVNPALDKELRVPIEDIIGLVSRPYDREEQWFPCRKGDWVVVNGGSRARVVSLSHEHVEVVERGGRRLTYPTDVFLQSCPANLSRNFRLRVPFGVCYSLQNMVTSSIPEILKEYLSNRMEVEGYAKNCLNLQVEFLQANVSSLDLMVLADFKGEVADICKRIERAIQKWCVDCCSEHDWEIPFPQLTVHRAD